MTHLPISPVDDTAESSALDDGRPRRWWRPSGRRRVAPTIAGLAVIAVVGTGVVLLLQPTDDKPAASASATVVGNGLAEVTRQTLEARTQVDGTLEYDASAPVTIPVGTDTAALQHAKDSVAAAATTLSSDRVGVRDAVRSSRQSTDSAAVAKTAAKRALGAAIDARTINCSVPASAECAAARQQVDTARNQLAQARAALASARAQATAAAHQAQARVNADEAALMAAQTALAQAQRTAVNPGVTVTAVAEVGDSVTRGGPLYALDGVSVPLFYGTVTPWRALYRGVSAGSDVAELNANLAALGYGTGLAGSRDFTAATEQAVRAWQKDMHAAQDGVVALGDIAYRKGPVIVSGVTASKGDTPKPGSPVLTTSSKTRVVTVPLDTDRQGDVKVGDEVSITLPDGSNTPGRVTKVGTVATKASDAQSGDSAGAASAAGSSDDATVEVRVKLLHPDKIGDLDQAPVQVAITTARQADALVVPLAALLARPGGAYAVEVVEDDGTHNLITVKIGLVDDANSRVAVEGDGLVPGQKIVVPQA